MRRRKRRRVRSYYGLTSRRLQPKAAQCSEDQACSSLKAERPKLRLKCAQRLESIERIEVSGKLVCLQLVICLLSNFQFAFCLLAICNLFACNLQSVCFPAIALLGEETEE